MQFVMSLFWKKLRVYLFQCWCLGVGGRQKRGVRFVELE